MYKVVAVKTDVEVDVKEKL